MAALQERKEEGVMKMMAMLVQHNALLESLALSVRYELGSVAE